jgi:hypothetical protein
MLSAPVFAEESATPPMAGTDKAIAAEALDQPKVDEQAVKDFATNSAVGVMTFGNANFQARFLEASPHFTKSGWQSFSAVLKTAGTFDQVTKKHYSLTAEAAGPAQIKKQGVTEGVYRWEVEIPLTIHFKNSDDEHDEELQVRAVIERVPAADSSNGILIGQWMAH